MNWFFWLSLFAAIAVAGLALHAWLWWRLWGKARALAHEAGTVAAQAGDMVAQLGELGLSADGAHGRRPRDENDTWRARERA